MINAFNPEAFLKKHWQKSPCVIKNAIATPINYLSANDLAGMSLDDEIESRIIRNDNNHWQLFNGPFEEATYSDLPESHWTLLVQTVEHWLPEVYELLNLFDFIPRWRFDDLMVSYATDQGGVGPHFDHYDVFLIQSEGKRRWRVGNKGDTQNQQSIIAGLKHLDEFKPAIDIILEPGDILYIPPETPHWGISIGESMGYSVGFRSPQTKDLMALLAEHFETSLTNRFFTDEYRQQINDTQLIEPELIQWAEKELKTISCDKALLYQLLAQSLSHAKIDTPSLPLTSKPTQLSDINSIQLITNLNRNYYECTNQLIISIEGDSYYFSQNDAEFVRSVTKGELIRLNIYKNKFTSVEFSETLTTMIDKGYFNLA